MRIDGPQITGSFSLNGDGVQDLDVFATTSSLNTYTSSTDTMMGHVLTATHSLNTFTSSAGSRMVSIEGKTGSYATTGSNTFVGLQTIQGSIVPSAHATYDLGSAGYNFRHLYLSSASLYIDGTKVLGSTTQELQITTDNGQSFKILEAGSDTITLQSADGNITLATSGGGDVILDPTTGVIGLKGTITVYTGNKITSSDGNSVQFGNGIAVTGSIVSTATPLISGSGQISGLGFATTGSNTFNGNLTVTGYIDTQELRTTFISSSILYRSGSTKFGDESTDTHSFTGSLTTTTSVTAGNGFVATGYPAASGNGLFIAFNSAGTNTGSLYSYNYNTSTYLPTVIDGSSVLLYNSGVAKMGVVGGNVGINKVSSLNAVLDVNGNTLISGSLTSTGNLRAGGISIGVAPTANVLDIRGENNTYDGTIILGARGTIQHRDAGQTILSIANDYNSNTAKFEIRMKGNTTSDAKLTILGSGDATFSNTLQANAKLYLQRASTGADTLIQFKNEVGVDKAYIKFGGTDEELAFYAGAGGTRNLIIGPSGEMAFNTSTAGVRSYLFKALSGRQLAIEALETGGVHSIYLRPSSSGRNLITSNYFSGGVYLPLALSGRENDSDLVLSNGNVGINDTSPSTKLSINGANYVEMATFACTSAASSTIVSNNSGYVQFSSGNARHCSNSSLFVPTTDGIQITKAGIVHVVFSQDITTAGTTGYVAGYIQKNKNTISENLITNTGGQWDGINGCATIDVAANDVINFTFNATDITSFDANTWSQYSFIWTSR